MNRTARADGIPFALEAAAELAQPMPEPLQPLDPCALEYWPKVIGTKRTSSWTDPDLLVAGQLCRDYALAEQIAEELKAAPTFAPDAKGVIRVHPGHALAEQVQRRIIAAMRVLQINAASVNGRARDQAEKNQAVRELAGMASDDESLFARPRPG